MNEPDESTPPNPVDVPRAASSPAPHATEVCVGCGADLPCVEGPTHRYMESAPGCWALYGEVLARLLSDPRAEDVRRRSADAFAVQHPGRPSPQAIQSVAGHLMSLYAQLELGQPPRSAHAIIEAAVRAEGAFRWLTPPASMGRVTVGDVLAHPGPLDEATREWAREAWNAWAAWHGQIRDWHRILTSTMHAARGRPNAR